MANRYYSEDDPETGVTREQLQALSAEEQRAYMIDWFGRNFEDPAEKTPYNGREGGYQFIWGGPYDAREELWSEFGGLVSEEAIEEAADDVEGDGITDWAPGPEHDDHEIEERLPPLPIGQAYVVNDGTYLTNSDGAYLTTSVEPNLDEVSHKLESEFGFRYGSSEDWEQRRILLHHIYVLEQELAHFKPARAGIGHNNPPSDAITPPSALLPAEIVTAAADAVEAIKSELAKSEPNTIAVAQSGSILQKFAHWAAAKADIFAQEFVKAFGKSLGTAAGIALPLAAAGLIGALGLVVHATIAWLGAVSWPL